MGIGMAKHGSAMFSIDEWPISSAWCVGTGLVVATTDGYARGTTERGLDVPDADVAIIVGGALGEREHVLGKRVDVSPEGVEVQDKALAARDRVLTLARIEGNRVAAVRAKLEDGDDPHVGIDEPVEADAERRVLEELRDAVALLVTGKRGENLDRNEGLDLDQGSATGRGGGTATVDGSSSSGSPSVLFAVEALAWRRQQCALPSSQRLRHAKRHHQPRSKRERGDDPHCGREAERVRRHAGEQRADRIAEVAPESIYAHR
jgi:hypothetical protein